MSKPIVKMILEIRAEEPKEGENTARFTMPTEVPNWLRVVDGDGNELTAQFVDEYEGDFDAVSPEHPSSVQLRTLDDLGHMVVVVTMPKPKPVFALYADRK